MESEPTRLCVNSCKEGVERERVGRKREREYKNVYHHTVFNSTVNIITPMYCKVLRILRSLLIFVYC